ncbi:MAG: rod shape-determining protein MreC [Oscillospiraceae bacterium]|jgi:rod shape-determining protein MreC|nr:rod shape-determining protein MreC [Oscillospiraceae bacterium]
MQRFLKSRWFKFIIVLFVLLIIGIIVAAVSSNGASPFSSVAGTIFEPFQRAASSIGNQIGKIGNNFSSFSTDREEMEKLNERLADYQKQLIDYEQSKQKVELYEDYLKIHEEHSDFKVQPVRVIGRDSANYFYSLVLSKGSTDGISPSDPVITGRGQLIGLVTKVGPTYCVVSTIFDPSVKISAYEIRSREVGFVSTEAGVSKKQLTRLMGLDRNTQIATGGIVCTTGEGGSYPRDLIIGTVKEVKNDDRDISYYALIEPDFDITQIENALIITGFDGKGIITTGD